MSTINLGACENLLKNYYNFSSNQTLYRKKIELVQDEMKISKIE